MSYRPLITLLVLAPLVQVGSAFAQVPPPASCKPNYQVTQTACRDSDEITGYATIVDRHVRVNAGACKVPDAIGLCREYIAVYQRNNPAAEHVEVSNPTTEGIPQFCGDISKLRQKMDVFCDFTFQKAQHRKVVDANCPVEKIEDANGCFAANAPTLDQSAVTECLAMKVTTTADVWIKGVCLNDINQAALNLDLSQTDYDRVQSKLGILKKKIQDKPGYAKLNQLLETK